MSATQTQTPPRFLNLGDVFNPDSEVNLLFNWIIRTLSNEGADVRDTTVVDRVGRFLHNNFTQSSVQAEIPTTAGEVKLTRGLVELINFILLFVTEEQYTLRLGIPGLAASLFKLFRDTIPESASRGFEDGEYFGGFDRPMGIPGYGRIPDKVDQGEFLEFFQAYARSAEFIVAERQRLQALPEEERERTLSLMRELYQRTGHICDHH